MLKLIHLEMEKNNASKWVLYAALSLLIPLIFVLAAGTAGRGDLEESMSIAQFIRLMVGFAFLIFAGVMHSAFTVSEYKNKTIDLMFSYPIKRRKILAAKILAVVGFNFVAIIIAQLVCHSALSILSRIITPAYPVELDLTSVSFYVGILLNALSIACMSIIALFVGMVSKSSVATVVASFVPLALIGGNLGGGASQVQTVGMPIVFTAVSIVIAVIMLSGVEKKDIL